VGCWQVVKEVVVVRGQFFEPIAVEQKHAQCVVGRAARSRAASVFGLWPSTHWRLCGLPAVLRWVSWPGLSRGGLGALLPEGGEVVSAQAA